MSDPLRAAEHAAEVARMELGISNEAPLPDLVPLLESTGLGVFLVPLGSDGLAGAYSLDRDVGFLLVNSNQAPVRQRFTLAHEYAHHRLGHGSLYDITIDQASTDPREAQANRLAGALLMPRAAVSRWFDDRNSPPIDLEAIVRMAAWFGVSAAAARVRLEIIGRLKPGAAIRALDRAISVGDHSQLARNLGIVDLNDTIARARDAFRAPAVMRQHLLTAYRERLVDEKAVASILRISKAELKRMLAADGDDELPAEILDSARS